MKHLCIIIFTFALFSPPDLCAQLLSGKKTIERAEKEKADKWPLPSNNYQKGTVGNYLQEQFYKQCNYCGFIAKLESNRDYIPNDLSSFVRDDLLNRSAESMNISGTSFLQYIFHNDQLMTKLDKMQPNPTTIIKLNEKVITANLLSKADFPAYIYSKNCVGIIKAAMDANFDPPMASFKSAVNQDSKKESAIIVYQGWFISPIFKLLAESSPATTHLLSNLWNFYSQNGKYDGSSYYIKQFKGLTIGRTGSNQEYRSLEVQGSLNANFGMTSLNFDTNYGVTINNSFSGTDYQTLVYDLFDNNGVAGAFKRTDMFGDLPSSKKIIDYFNSLKPKVTSQPESELMAQSSEHTHYVALDGLPAELCSPANWSLKMPLDDTYKSDPDLSVNQILDNGRPVGCRFTVKGIPNDKYFVNKIGSIPVKYQIESTNKVSDRPIVININSSFNTTEQPVLSSLASNIKWEIEDIGSGKFRLRWKTIVSFTDSANPVDYTVGKVAQCVNSGCKASLGDKTLNVSARLSCNQSRQYELDVVYLDPMSYADVDLAKNSLSLNFDGQFAIPLKAGGTVSKQITGILNYPATKDVTVANEVTIGNTLK